MKLNTNASKAKRSMWSKRLHRQSHSFNRSISKVMLFLYVLFLISQKLQFLLKCSKKKKIFQ